MSALCGMMLLGRLRQQECGTGFTKVEEESLSGVTQLQVCGDAITERGNGSLRAADRGLRKSQAAKPA